MIKKSMLTVMSYLPLSVLADRYINPDPDPEWAGGPAGSSSPVLYFLIYFAVVLWAMWSERGPLKSMLEKHPVITVILFLFAIPIAFILSSK